MNVWQPPNITATCPAQSQLEACTYFGYLYLNLLVTLYGSSPQKTPKTEEGGEYDFIVVGAGAAGSVVAGRLTEIEDWKVLLLEAGPEQADVTRVPGFDMALLGSSIDWQYSTEPNGKSCLARPGQRCAWPRGKTMGGTTSINSMSYVRGNKLDYDNWAAMGNEGWSYKEVLPFFKKSEHNLNVEGLDRKYHGVAGPQYVSRFPYIDEPSIMMTEAFNERGLPILDYNGKTQDGTMQVQNFAVNGERNSANDAYITPIRYKRNNLVIKTDSEAVKILFDKHKRAYGVKYVAPNGQVYTATARKEVIVSGGVVNSPKLLLLSGVGPRKQLQRFQIPVVADLAVGENLMDHVTFNGLLVALPNETATTVSQKEVIGFVKEHRNMKYPDGPLASLGPVGSVGFVRTEPNLPAPDIQFQAASVNWKEYVREPILSDALSIFPSAFYNAIQLRSQNCVPQSKGRIVLNPKSPNGKPLIQPNYFDKSEDLIPLVKGARFLISLEDTYAFKSRGAKFVKIPLEACKDLTWGTDEYIICLARQYTMSPAHTVGTCKMGPKWDKTAVVDPRLRVYGVSGLRVIDASIMPVPPRANTNAPTMMIGEKGAEYIKEDWLDDYRK